MPRTYSFDHFKLASSDPRSRSLRNQDKQHLADTLLAQAHGEEGIHYGRNHAETEEILKARAMAPKPRREAPAPLPSQVPPRVAAPRINRNTTPIGALPATEELPPRGRFQDLLDEAERQFDALQSGVGDVGKAAVRLATLPLEVMRLAARRLRVVTG